MDWAKYQNRHSSKSIWVMNLFFCQNYCPIRWEFWQKNRFITHILFELCLFWYLAHSQILGISLYVSFFRFVPYSFIRELRVFNLNKLTYFYCPVLKDIRRLCQKMSDTSVARFNDQKINLSYVRGNPRENSNGYASFIRFNICWGLCFAISMCFIVAFLLLAHYFNADKRRNQTENVVHLNMSELLSNGTFEVLG